jgi:phosphate transport system permease protein
MSQPSQDFQAAFRRRGVVSYLFAIFAFLATIFGLAILLVFICTLVQDIVTWYRQTPRLVAERNAELQQTVQQFEEEALAKVKQDMEARLARARTDEEKANVRRLYEERIIPAARKGLEKTLAEKKHEIEKDKRDDTSPLAITAHFLTHGPSPQKQPQDAGIRPALLGSLYVVLITIVVAVPLGVGAAIFLEEYRADTWIARVIQININNLAGVPSIMFGILGAFAFVELGFKPVELEIERMHNIEEKRGLLSRHGFSVEGLSNPAIVDSAIQLERFLEATDPEVNSSDLVRQVLLNRLVERGVPLDQAQDALKAPNLKPTSEMDMRAELESARAKLREELEKQARSTIQEKRGRSGTRIDYTDKPLDPAEIAALAEEETQRRAEEAAHVPQALVGELVRRGLPEEKVRSAVDSELLREAVRTTGVSPKNLEREKEQLKSAPAWIYRAVAGAAERFGLNIAARNLLGGGLTLALLALPVIIVSSQEAIRAVPQSLRHGSLALGATRWQTISKIVLPSALPGILTGTILSMCRAIGEAAPMVMFGALLFVDQDPTLFGRFTVMPMQIYAWTGRPEEAWRHNAGFAIAILVGILLLLNGLAIYMRQRSQRQVRY